MPARPRLVCPTTGVYTTRLGACTTEVYRLRDTGSATSAEALTPAATTYPVSRLERTLQ